LRRSRGADAHGSFARLEDVGAGGRGTLQLGKLALRKRQPEAGPPLPRRGQGSRSGPSQSPAHRRRFVLQWHLGPARFSVGCASTRRFRAGPACLLAGETPRGIDDDRDGFGLANFTVEWARATSCRLGGTDTRNTFPTGRAEFSSSPSTWVGRPQGIGCPGLSRAAHAGPDRRRRGGGG